MLRRDLEGLSREELVARAESAGIARPRSLTTAELLDELVLRGDARAGRASRGWFGRARDLLKSAISKGLELPETGQRVAKAASRSWPPAPPPPLPTVTLAEIYAAQGHLERALQVLEEVLAKEPDHAEASRLKEEYAERAARVVGRAEADQADAAATAPAGAKEAETASEEAAEATDHEAEGEDDLDEVVAVAVDPSTVYLYWEVRAEPVASARLRAPHGALAVRTVTVAAGPGGPISNVRDDRVDALSGELFVRGLRGGSHVRVSVGWLSQEGFVPFAVAPDVSTPRGATGAAVATQLGTWSPPSRGGALSARPPRYVGDAAPIGAAGAARTASQGSAPRTGRPGGPPEEGRGAPGGGRTVWLQPTEVFDLSPGAAVPIGFFQAAGSSELQLLFGDARRRGLRGGASEQLLGGASEGLLGASSR